MNKLWDCDDLGWIVILLAIAGCGGFFSGREQDKCAALPIVQKSLFNSWNAAHDDD